MVAAAAVVVVAATVAGAATNDVKYGKKINHIQGDPRQPDVFKINSTQLFFK